MKKRFVLLLCILCFCVGIIVKINILNEQISSNLESNQKKVSYDDYESIFKYIVENISIDGFNVRANTLGNNMTIIDKDLSFNKRETLTLQGNANMNIVQPTDEQLTLESNNNNTQITISILYLDTYIGNDFIAFPNNLGFDDLNEDLINKAVLTSFTYKNLIFLVHQVASDEYDVDLMNNINRELIKLVNAYKI